MNNKKQYYLCGKCGRLYYLESKNEIHVPSRLLVPKECWEYYLNRDCKQGHLKVKALTNHGNTTYTRHTRAARIRLMKIKNLQVLK